MKIWPRDYSLVRLNEMGRGNLAEHLGIEFTAIDDDSLSARMPVDRRTCQPAGLLHGGASVALAETLGSFAGSLVLTDPSATVVGLEINANHVRGVRDGWVTGTARPLHLGRSTQVWEIRITDEAQQLVCISRLTVAVVVKRKGERQTRGEGHGEVA